MYVSGRSDQNLRNYGDEKDKKGIFEQSMGHNSMSNRLSSALFELMTFIYVSFRKIRSKLKDSW